VPELPSTPRGAATSRRILDAAAEEFSERGIAGARIERIIAAANTNKAQLYGYFGGKEGLFDAVIADRVGWSTRAVPFDADDLAGWALSVYDQVLRQTDLIRLITWIRLERRPAGLWFDNPEDYEAKLAAIAAAQAAGRLRAGDPFDLLALVLAMACAWSPVSGSYTATADEPPAAHERRRAMLRACVESAVAP
jgi:AcrR family transcriptional regulator